MADSWSKDFHASTTSSRKHRFIYIPRLKIDGNSSPGHKVKFVGRKMKFACLCEGVSFCCCDRKPFFHKWYFKTPLRRQPCATQQIRLTPAAVACLVR